MSQVVGGVRDSHGEYLEASELRVNLESIQFSAGEDVNFAARLNVSVYLMPTH